MRTQNRQGSFITLIRTFLAKAKEVSRASSNADTDSSPIPPHAETVANLLLLRTLSLKLQERLAEEDRRGERTFRYSSSNSYTSFCSSSLRGVLK